MKLLSPTLLVLLLCFSAHAQWVKQTVSTTASFRGLSVVNEKVVWASGTGGTVVRTIDGGKSWSIFKVPGADKLDFRDIEAFDSKTAYILSIGNGDSSRIYKTTDGGSTWRLQFTNTDPKAFYDALACWDRTSCIAMSDPVEGFYRLLETKNGGDAWTVIGTEKMDNAGAGEAAFAASGTCLITHGKNGVFLVTGGSNARVFRSNNRGDSWLVAEAPIAKGSAGSGIFSIAMRDEKRGIIVGGNYEKPGDKTGTAAITEDGGRTWKAADGLGGYRSAVSYIDDKKIIAVGTNGADVSFDGGNTWRPAGTENFNAVQSDKRKTAWAVGPNGLVARSYWGR